MPKAYSYLRFSTPEQLKGDSFRRQTELAERYAANHGLTLDTELRLTDEGVSAFRSANKRIGALGRFLREIEDGNIDEGSFLLVENLDRVSRASPWDAMPTFQQIINAGVTIVTLQDEKVWSQDVMRENPYRIFESIIVMIRANEESATKSRRLKAVWSNKRAKARTEKLTARCPAWLSLRDNQFHVDEYKAAIVQRIYTLASQGLGQHKITETLNKEGIPAFRNAKFWHRSYVHKLLNSEAPMGTFVPHETIYNLKGMKERKASEPIPNYFPPIIDVETNVIVKQLTSGSRVPLVKQGNQIMNVIASLAKCPVCNGTMTRVNKGSKGGRPYLVCQSAKVGAGCTYHSVPYEAIEASIVSRYEEWLSDAPIGNEALEDEYESKRAALADYNDMIRNIVTSLSKSPSPALQKELSDFEQEKEDVERRLKELREQIATTSNQMIESTKRNLGLACEKEPLDRGEVNRCMRLLMSSVIVDYLDGSLRFQWKQGGETTSIFDARNYFKEGHLS